MRYQTFLATVVLSATAACGGGHSSAGTPSQTGATPGSADQAPVVNGTPTADTTAYKHHSVLAGAAVGAAGGHMLGHHAILGAAAGALIQHERNKHAAARP